MSSRRHVTCHARRHVGTPDLRQLLPAPAFVLFLPAAVVAADACRAPAFHVTPRVRAQARAVVVQ